MKELGGFRLQAFRLDIVAFWRFIIGHGSVGVASSLGASLSFLSLGLLLLTGGCASAPPLSRDELTQYPTLRSALASGRFLSAYSGKWWDIGIRSPWKIQTPQGSNDSIITASIASNDWHLPRRVEQVLSQGETYCKVKGGTFTAENARHQEIERALQIDLSGGPIGGEQPLTKNDANKLVRVHKSGGPAFRPPPGTPVAVMKTAVKPDLECLVNGQPLFTGRFRIDATYTTMMVFSGRPEHPYRLYVEFDEPMSLVASSLERSDSPVATDRTAAALRHPLV